MTKIKTIKCQILHQTNTALSITLCSATVVQRISVNCTDRELTVHTRTVYQTISDGGGQCWLLNLYVAFMTQCTEALQAQHTQSHREPSRVIPRPPDNEVCYEWPV